MNPAPPIRLLLAACIGSVGFLCSCEKAAPYLEAIKQRIDRETAAELQAAASAKAEADIPPPPEPVKMEPVVNKEARVSILGYHDFTEGQSTNDMILNIEDFRDQMQAIETARLPVVGMREFLDWKQGKGNIPEKCVMITIDDGWQATHTLALEVLKEYGYPFTIFLYKNYVGVGGRSLTHEQIRELAANGATICSHSTSHQNMSRRGGKSPAEYEAWLKEELEASHEFLVENFGDTGAIEKTFAFPYGIYNDQVLEMAEEFGYEACFTVNGKKTNWETEDFEIGRYVVHGTTLANFDAALDFGNGNVTSSGRQLMTESTTEDGETVAPLVTVQPPPDSTIGNRLPLIEVDLSRLEGVEPGSISMRISGFGKVPHRYDPAGGRVTYRIPQRLRLESYGVQVSFRHAGTNDNEQIAWTFYLDRLADYFSTEATEATETEGPVASSK
ncbi:MAG: polysaccharide deacetylase family protein [Verrucomicrobiales bacterium]